MRSKLKKLKKLSSASSRIKIIYIYTASEARSVSVVQSKKKETKFFFLNEIGVCNLQTHTVKCFV